jgi:hypothetical protein
VQTAGDIALQPRSAGTTVGVAGGAGVLDLSTAVLNMMTAGDEMIIGRVNGTGDMHVNARNWGSGLHLRGASGVINIDGNQDVGADNLTITSDADPVVVGALTGTGMLTLQQASNATTMGVAGGAGALNYSLADIAALGAGWTSLRLGSPTATGALTVGANAWDNPVTYRAAAGGSIVIAGAQTATAASDTVFTFSGPTTLSANVDTTNATGGTQDITFNNAVTLGANAQVLADGGDITFASTIDGAFDLTLSAAGVITLSDDVGAGTPLDDLTLTSDSDPAIAGALAGTGILTLQQASNATTMGVAGGAGTVNYSLADLAGLGNNWTSLRLGSTTATGALTIGARAWDLPVDYRAAAAGSIVISGAQTATVASDAIFTFTGPATINAALDLTGATGGTQAITLNEAAAVNADITSDSGDIAFNDTLSLAADIATDGGDITLADDVTLTGISSIDTGTADIAFAGTLDGAFDLELTTTGDITFTGNVGGVTPLGDVLIDPRHLTALGSFDAASFTLTNGTGNVSFAAATGLTTTGDIAIDTNGNITGIYTGANGVLEASAGTLTATVSFTTLDIDGAGGTLTAGYIGAPGAADQTMANLISIGGQRDPWPAGIPSPAYTIAAFEIGTEIGGGGGSGGNPPSPFPVTPGPDTRPPSPPPAAAPDESPAPPVTSPARDDLLHEISRIERSAQAVTQGPKHIPGPPHGKMFTEDATYSKNLLNIPGCTGSHRHASCSSLEMKPAVQLFPESGD